MCRVARRPECVRDAGATVSTSSPVPASQVPAREFAAMRHVRMPMGGMGGSVTAVGGASGSAASRCVSSTNKQRMKPSRCAALGANRPRHPSRHSVSP